MSPTCCSIIQDYLIKISSYPLQVSLHSYFFKYMENDTSVLSYLEPGLPVHISWNREVSRKQQMMQNQKHRAWHFMMGIWIASLAITVFLL